MPERTSTELFVIHCSATKPSADIGEDEIRRMHKNRGWVDIGYNIVIRRNGKIDFGRQMDSRGAHVKGFNSKSLGICLVGGLNESTGDAENNFTTEQFLSLEKLIVTLDLAYGAQPIVGHRDLSPDLDGDGIIEPHEWLKECPCFDAGEWASKVLLR